MCISMSVQKFWPTWKWATLFETCQSKNMIVAANYGLPLVNMGLAHIGWFDHHKVEPTNKHVDRINDEQINFKQMSEN